MILNNMIGGVGVAFGVLGVLAVSNAISTYIFNGKTLEEMVNERVGA